MAGFLWRTLVILHRYLGIAVGLLMLTWFLSGIVMMYVGFPQPLGAERVLSLPNINWQACCHVADGALSEGSANGPRRNRDASRRSGVAPSASPDAGADDQSRRRERGEHS